MKFEVNQSKNTETPDSPHIGGRYYCGTDSSDYNEVKVEWNAYFIFNNHERNATLQRNIKYLHCELLDMYHFANGLLWHLYPIKQMNYSKYLILQLHY